jgi:hypothetical protein
MSAAKFDPWAMLARLRAERLSAPSSISNFSSFSRCGASDFNTLAGTDDQDHILKLSAGQQYNYAGPPLDRDTQYLKGLAARRRKAISEGRVSLVPPHVIAALKAAGLHTGEDEG